MAEHRNQRRDDEEPLADEQERGRADDDFEDPDDIDEDEEADDEDLEAERDLISDATYTGEIGSEGGSRGDVEVERKRPRVMQGSESTTTGTPDQGGDFRDRKSGPGY